MDENLKREIILEHYQNPVNKGLIEDDTYLKSNTNNDSCIDEINLMAKIEDGVLKGKNGKPFTSSLTTYFMGIAKLKYKEWVRDHPIGPHIEPENGKKLGIKSDEDLYRDILYDEGETAMLSIIADCISRMSERCNQILTLFYYEEKSLDEILDIIPSYKSKNALKTEKNKCMNTLRESANAIYKRFFI